MPRDLAQHVFEIESQSIAALADRLDESFDEAVRILLNLEGRAVTTGMGKSGAVARKLASTLASTGTPSLFLHPAEGLHGDLGMVTRGDALIALSYSGATEEFTNVLPYARSLGIPIIGMTGRQDSFLGQVATVVLNVRVEREACPLNLAPTASAVAMMAMGDALALAVMSERKFTREDFARFHPGGTLGRKLLLRVRDIMRTGEQVAIVRPDTTVHDALFAITQARGGSALVSDQAGRLVGIVTDGDIRRRLVKNRDALDWPVERVMTSSPIHVDQDALAAEALRIMREHPIDDLPATDSDGRIAGILDLQDLVRAGIY